MNKKNIIITSLVTILPMLAGLAMWNMLPESVPVHWNFRGEIDDYGSKAFAVFFIPAFMLAMHLICVLATRIDPKNQNMNHKVLGLVLWICPVTSVLSMGACFAAALEFEVDVSFIFPLFIGVLFFAIGNYLPKCKRNYTIGIKIPWTLESDENWNKTHRFAGVLWIVCSLVIMVGAFWRSAVVYTTFVPLAIMVVAPMIYSYLLYKNNNK